MKKESDVNLYVWVFAKFIRLREISRHDSMAGVELLHPDTVALQ